ncbi:MAG: hypothetical protein HS115_02510 [Spirochaetales bacterium]|nr:hypothetical protein [Spirochaetales bacterium]
MTCLLGLPGNDEHLMRPVVNLLPVLLLIWNCAVVETSCQSFDAGCNPLTVSLLYTVGQVTVPRAHRLYVSHSGVTTINAYTISAPGQLSLMQSVNLTNVSEQLALAADNRYLYAAEALSNAVTPIAVSDTGFLSPMPSITGFNTPFGVTTSSSNRLFVSNQGIPYDVRSYTIQGDGTISLLGSTSGSMINPRAIAIHPGGRFVQVALENGSLGSALLSLNSIGAPTWVSNTNIAGTTNVYGLTYDFSGNYLLLASIAAPNTLFSYQVNQTDGSLNLTQTQSVGGNVRYGIASHPALPIVYLAYETVSAQIDAYAIAPGGSISLRSSISLPATGSRTILVDKLGLALYSINSNGNVYGVTLNPGTGDFVSVTGPFFSDTNPVGGALLHRPDKL